MADEKRSLRDAIRDRQSGDGAAAESPGAALPQEGGGMNKQIHLFGPSLKELAALIRNLSTLLNVGIPLQRSLQILAERTQHPKLRKVVEDLSEHIDSGSALAEGMEKHKDVFPPLVINIVRIGESGGILESSLSRLTEILESKIALNNRVRTATMYPGIVFSLLVFVAFWVLTQAVPALAEPLRERGALDESGFTGVLVGLSSFTIAWWWAIIILIVGGAVGLFFYLRTPGGAAMMESLLLSIPSVRVLPRNVSLARAMRSLGSLQAAGIPLLESLKVTADSSESPRMREALYRVHNSLESGGKFETPLRKETDLFPPFVTDMIAVGEEAGALDTMLLNIADNAENEVNAAVSTLEAIIEPVLFIFMGIMVVLVALALVLPYMDLLNEHSGM